MRVIHSAQELHAEGRKVCLAMGFFDGVHLGHQQIIRQTVSDARLHRGLALVLTFDRHPRSVLDPARVPPLIYPLPRKIRTVEGMGADALLLLHFDAALCRMPGETFIRTLAADLGEIQSICVGSNFVFGHNRGGNVQLLQRLGAELKFAVHGVASVALDGHLVSSTRIRGCIQSGNLDLAGQMLGRAYSLSGKVVKGDELGRTLGFPTANLDCAGLALPPGGVYAVRVNHAQGAHQGVLNIGVRPTVSQAQAVVRVEAHLLGFQGDLYGQELELTGFQKLRDEIKFASLKELQEQIGRDAQDARRVLSS